MEHTEFAQPNHWCLYYGKKTYITYRAAFSISCRAKARLLFSYDFKIADICPPNLRVHHAAFHTGNHELSLSGLKRSFGNWRKPGNQRQLGASWCKAEKKKKNLPPLLPGTSCLPVPLARLSFLLPSHVISVICLSSLAGIFHMSYFQVHLNKQESILLYISISSQIPSKLPLFAPLSSLSPISSLWCQSDSLLTIGPAGNLQREKSKVAAGLRSCTLSVLHQPFFRHPYVPRCLLKSPLGGSYRFKLNHRSTSANCILSNLGSVAET